MICTIYQDMFPLLRNAPDGQIDAHIVEKFKKMDPDNFTSDQLLEILDECAYAALASDFAMNMMNILWETKLSDEGKTKEQALKEAEPRRMKRV